MTSRQRYFLPLSSLNLNGIFASESISPHSFYNERLFGVSYNTLTDNNGTPIQSNNCLILYPDLFDFRPSSGSPVFFVVYEDNLDKKYLIEDENSKVIYYFKTIYLRKGNFILFFRNEEDKYLFLAIAAPSMEVKTIAKYNQKHSFVENKEIDIFFNLANNSKYTEKASKESSFVINHLNLKRNSNIYLDKAFNHIKGFIYGFLVGSLGKKSENEIALEQTFQELQNLITGIKGKIEITQDYHCSDFDSFNKELNKSHQLFKIIFPEIQNYSYENIKIRVEELIKLQELRFTELARQKYSVQKIDQVEVIKTRTEINALENSLSNLYKKEQDFREKKKELESQSKSIKRPKPNTPEKLERERLEDEIEQLKQKISELSPKKHELKQQISHLKNNSQEDIEYGKTQFDNSVDEQYLKISEYINGLLFFAIQNLKEQKRQTSYRSSCKKLMLQS